MPHRRRAFSEMHSTGWKVVRSQKPYKCQSMLHNHEDGPHILTSTLYAYNQNFVKRYCLECFRKYAPLDIVRAEAKRLADKFKL